MLSREKGIIPLLENMDLLLNEILVGSLSVSTSPHHFEAARGGRATSALSTPGDRNLRLHPDMAPLRWKPSLRRTLDLDVAGPLVQSRVTGAFEAMRSRLPGIPAEFLVRMKAREWRDKSFQLVLDFLKRYPKDRGILIAAATDTSALGAVQAVRELKREKYAAIVGQDCVPEALPEISRSDSPLIGSVFHKAQSDGPRLIHLGLSLLSGHPLAPYNYFEHKMMTGPWATQGGKAT
jgi:hypothetical protein